MFLLPIWVPTWGRVHHVFASRVFPNINPPLIAIAQAFTHAKLRQRKKINIRIRKSTSVIKFYIIKPETRNVKT